MGFLVVDGDDGDVDDAFGAGFADYLCVGDEGEGVRSGVGTVVSVVNELVGDVGGSKGRQTHSGGVIQNRAETCIVEGSLCMDHCMVYDCMISMSSKASETDEDRLTEILSAPV